MFPNTKPIQAILLSLIALLFFFGCGKMEKEESTSATAPKLFGPEIAAKSGEIMSTTGIPMIDLGPGCAYGVNASGEVVGSPGFLWSKHQGLTPLGSLGTPQFSWANDVNDPGQIAGTSWEPGTTQLRAILWTKRGEITNLGTSGDPSMPPDNAFSTAFGINNRGDIVGDADNFAFLWTERHGMVLLGCLAGEPTDGYSAAWAINERGWIAGISQVSFPPQYHGTLWTDIGEMFDLGTLRSQSQALGINNRGEIVGGSSNDVATLHERIGSDFNHSCVAFIWTQGHGMSPIPTLGGDAGCAHAINESGRVVGWSYTGANQVHAFTWTAKNGIEDLGTLPGAAMQESVAFDINNRGQVVGYSMAEDGNHHAVIWDVK
jgi:probable HAF family extracellular repeat protein